MKQTNSTGRQQPNRRPIDRNMSGDERIVNRTTQRRKKNKRKKLIVRSVIFFLFLVIGVILVLTMFFNISEITVSGDAVYPAKDVVNSSGVVVGDNLIFISKDEINEKISTELPYVDSVKIKRHLPTGLELIITRTEAKYAIIQDGYYTLLNKNGKVLESGLEFIGENITLLNMGEITSADIGTDIVPANEKVFDKLVLVSNACEECNLENITSIDLSDIYNIKLVYQGRITLELGETDKDNTYKKLALGKSAIETQNEENEYYKGTINLTVEGKGYWSEETSTTEPQTEEPSSENDANEGESNEENTSEEQPAA